MRQSGNYYKNGILHDGYDYEHQAWVVNGKYIKCAHPDSISCGCYGKKHAGESCKVGI